MSKYISTLFSIFSKSNLSVNSMLPDVCTAKPDGNLVDGTNVDIGKLFTESIADKTNTIEPTGFSSGTDTRIVGSLGDHEPTVNFGFNSLYAWIYTVTSTEKPDNTAVVNIIQFNWN